MIHGHIRPQTLVPLTFAAALILLTPVAGAQGAPNPQSVVPIPFTSVYAGQPGSTYNATAYAGPACTSGEGLVGGSGDGCPFAISREVEPLTLAIDSNNNIVDAESYNGAFHVYYQGGTALAAALHAANPQYTFTVTPGRTYDIGRYSTATASPFNCGGSAANGVGLDAFGDGCPAHWAYLSPRAVAFDSLGNVFMTNTPETGGFANVRIMFVQDNSNGTITKMIQQYAPGVTPQPGFIYALSASGDFTYSSITAGIADIVVDSNENIYVSDNNTTVTTGLTGLGATTAGNQIKKFTASNPSGGWTTYLSNGTTGAAQTGSSSSGTYGAAAGDGQSVASLETANANVLYEPNILAVDANSNLYIMDSGNQRIRVVYNGGTTPPLYVCGTNTYVTSPVVGDIYTVAGGLNYNSGNSGQHDDLILSYINGDSQSQFNSYTSTTNQVPASRVVLNSAYQMGLDNAGNLIIGTKTFYSAPETGVIKVKIAAGTGQVTAIGGLAAIPTYGSNQTTPAAGTTCNGSTGGPVMSDAYGDGCPATEVLELGSFGRIVSDTTGNFYAADTRNSVSSAGSVIRKYSFNENFGSVPAGTVTAATATATVSGTAVTAIALGTGGSGYTVAPAVTFSGGGGGGAAAVATVANGIVTGVTLTSQGYGYTSAPTVSFSTNSVTLPLAFTFGGNTAGSPVYGTLGTGQTVSTATAPTISFTGSSAADFTDSNNGGAPDNCSESTYTASSSTTDPIVIETCVYYVTFTPSTAGLRQASVTISQNGGAAIGSVDIGGVGVGPQLAIDPTGAMASTNVIGPVLSPAGVGLDQSGNEYISNGTDGYIYKSTAGATPVKFSATALSGPTQIAVGGNGTLYVAETGNNTVASISTAGVVSSFETAAGGTSFSAPSGVAVDGAGNVYISDTGNNRVVEAVSSSGSVNTLSSALSAPKGLAVDASGNVFVADSGNHRIAELTPGPGLGNTSTLYALSSYSGLTTPVGVAVDPAGDLLVADSGATSVVMIPVTGSQTTLLSNVSGLTGLSADNLGDIFYTSSSAAGLTELNRTQISYDYPTTAVSSNTPQVLTLTNTGNASVTTGSSLSLGSDATNFSIAAATSNGCSASETLTSGKTCGLSAVFQPQSTGSFTDNVSFPGYTQTNALSATLCGTGGSGTESTGVTLALGSSSIVYGQAALVIATVTPCSTAASGTVTLTIDGGTLQTATLSGGRATFSVTGLQGGSHSFTASYNPASGFGSSSTSSGTSLTVTKATLTVTGVCSNRVYGQVNNCSATVTGYQYSDTAAAVFTVAPGGTTTALRDSVHASYPVTPTSGTLSAFGSTNYTLNLVNGSFTVSGGAVQSIIFPALPNFAHGGIYQLAARTTSGLAITYTVTVGGTIASVSGTTLTVTGTGAVTIQAVSVTDPTGDYAAATAVSQSFTAQ